MNRKFFVVSDIHSFYDELMVALTNQNFDKNNPDHVLICCGDLFDRGKQTTQLYNFCRELGDRFIYIKGNHEYLLDDCVYEMRCGKHPSSHHCSNGTVQTILNLVGMEYNSPWFIPYIPSNTFTDIIDPFLEWIHSKTIDYFQLGKYVFCHGWIPRGKKFYEEFSKITPEEKEDASWKNGMSEWKKGETPPDTIVVCGHFHCSWGWSHIRQQRKEYPQKNQKDWLKSFEPFIDNGIMAIDACTAYTGVVNCVVIDEKDI